MLGGDGGLRADIGLDADGWLGSGWVALQDGSIDSERTEDCLVCFFSTGNTGNNYKMPVMMIVCTCTYMCR